MQPIRLFVLGTLAQEGEMHGYQIHRVATTDRTETWAGVKPGSVHAALKRLATEGLVEVVRTEQSPTAPQRTIYRITQAGRTQLGRERSSGLQTVTTPADPVDLALRFADDLDPAELASVLRTRERELADRLAATQQILSEVGVHLRALEMLTFDHSIRGLQMEVDWHRSAIAAVENMEGEGE